MKTPHFRISAMRIDAQSANKQAFLIFSFLAIFSLFFLSFANDKKDKDRNRNNTDDGQNSLAWKLDATISNISFYHAISECDGKKIAFLKFVNNNSFTAKISWKETVKTQFKTEENLFRGEQHLALPPGETFEKDCSASLCKACLILPGEVNPAYPAQIEDFTFKNISVSR